MGRRQSEQAQAATPERYRLSNVFYKLKWEDEEHMPQPAGPLRGYNPADWPKNWPPPSQFTWAPGTLTADNKA
jgi:hypothetical protein